MRKGTAEAGMKQIEHIAHDLDQLTFGLAVDTEAKSVHFDIGDDIRRRLGNGQGRGRKDRRKSDFAGFLLPNAALNFNLSQKLDRRRHRSN